MSGDDIYVQEANSLSAFLYFFFSDLVGSFQCVICTMISGDDIYVQEDLPVSLYINASLESFP